MAKYDHGEPDEYEIVYKNGNVERIKAHQAICPSRITFTSMGSREHFMFHGEVDGKWRLLLTVDPNAVVSIRNWTRLEGIAVIGQEADLRETRES